jgi:type VI protein secretion system component Hcp
MKTDRERHDETVLLTDAELDAVVGGAAGDGKGAMHDFVIVRHLDKASAKLY